jgi:two-component system response regulator AlgR
MLKVLIVDDEPPARARLSRLVREMEECEVAGEADSAAAALEALAASTVDALLLDISMPGLDGMTLARQLAQQDEPPSVVFCTAWPDQALEAFECDAVDYLVKPVRADRLRTALEKVARIRGRSRDAQAASFLRSTVGGKTILVPVEEVICLLAEDKYTTVFHSGGETVINDSLVELEKRFGGRFLRIHRNALVALDRVRGLQTSSSGPAQLVLDGCDACPEVSRRHLPAVRKIVKELS